MFTEDYTNFVCLSEQIIAANTESDQDIEAAIKIHSVLPKPEGGYMPFAAAMRDAGYEVQFLSSDPETTGWPYDELDMYIDYTDCDAYKTVLFDHLSHSQAQIHLPATTQATNILVYESLTVVRVGALNTSTLHHRYLVDKVKDLPGQNPQTY